MKSEKAALQIWQGNNEQVPPLLSYSNSNSIVCIVGEIDIGAHKMREIFFYYNYIERNQEMEKLIDTKNEVNFPGSDREKSNIVTTIMEKWTSW